MRFSIILPIYRVEKYLREAVNSILRQSFTDFEIILVDDGSPDSCPKICDSIAALHPNIKVIHKPNGGLSDARNAGTAIAEGEYIIYLDSDDKWIDSDALALLDKLIDQTSPDVVIFGVEDYYPATGVRKVSRGNFGQETLNALPVQKLVEALMASNNFPGAAWMLATRRDFIEANKLRFVKGVTAEDFDWIVKAISKASSIKVLDRIVYQYRYNSDGSITSRPRLSGILGIHNAIANWLANEETSQFQSITNYLCGVYLQELLNFAGLDADDQKQAHSYLKSDRKILSYSNLVKYRLLNIILRICGVACAAKVVKFSRDTLKR